MAQALSPRPHQATNTRRGRDGSAPRSGMTVVLARAGARAGGPRGPRRPPTPRRPSPSSHFLLCRPRLTRFPSLGPFQPPRLPPFCFSFHVPNGGQSRGRPGAVDASLSFHPTHGQPRCTKSLGSRRDNCRTALQTYRPGARDGTGRGGAGAHVTRQPRRQRRASSVGRLALRPGTRGRKMAAAIARPDGRRS